MEFKILHFQLDIGGLLHKKSDVTPIYDSEAEMEVCHTANYENFMFF